MFGFKSSRSKERQLFTKKEKPRKTRARGNIRIRNTELENRIFKNRVLFGVICSIFLCLILFGNLYYLQVISHSTYQTRSNENRIRVLPVIPQRGMIYDRNMVVLAENLPVYHLMLYPLKEFDTKETVLKLNSLMDLGLSDADIKRIIFMASTRKRFTGIEISDMLSEDQIATFSVHRHAFPNVQVSSSLKRNYPFADVLTHAIGYVSRINENDIKRLTEEGKIDNYEGTSAIGKLGVESYYEDILHGITGTREVEVDSHGQIIRTLNYNPPIPGKNLVLTLDVRLQYYAQQLLGSMRGAIVVMDPNNGELLACYSNPSYDPNPFVRGIRSREYSKLLNNPNRPLINRATQGGYAPASTIKPLLGIMGLNENLITPTSTYFGASAFMLPGSTHRFRDWRASGHGWLDLYRAIEVSADTYFYDLAFRAGINVIHEYLDKYGFGRSTGIDIHEESLGVNPSREWKQKRFKQPWHMGDTVPIGIGQGYWTTTLMQLIKAHALVANKGHFVTPHFLKEIRMQNEKNSYKDPEAGKKLKVKSDSYFDVVRTGMYLVINGAEGTGRRAFHDASYKAAGKSGTAQVVSIKQDERYDARKLRVEHRDNALFVAFAPFYHPRVLAAVILENEGGGSAKGAPIIRQMMDKYFELYPGYMGEKTPVRMKFGLGGYANMQ